MAQVTNQTPKTQRQKYVGSCILQVQDLERARLCSITENPKTKLSYDHAAGIIGAALGRSGTTVKIWASIDKRDIPTDELEKLKTFMRKHYGQTVSS